LTPFVVGIAGGSASGKTTLARAVCEALDGQALPLLLDRYYRSLPPGRDPLDHNFDHPDALDLPRMVRDLQSLRAGQRTCVPSYDFTGHVRGTQEDCFDPRPVVLVEGILVLCSASLRSLMDARVYVEADASTRLARRIARDVVSRGRTPEDVRAQVARTVEPMHRAYVEPSRAFAQLVVDGTAPVSELVAQVLSLLPVDERRAWVQPPR
jgi:uridine kinase